MTRLTITGGLTTIEAARTSEDYEAAALLGAAYWIQAEDGLGMAPVRRLEERGPQQHGATDLGFRLDPRTITLVLGFQAGSLAEFYSRRETLLRLLRPTNTPLQLRWELENGERRGIFAHVASGPAMGSQDRLGLSQRAGVILRAADPLFFDWVGQSAVYGVGGGSSDAWIIPWAIPWTIGSSTIGGSRAITNPGSFDALPRIIITGPITSPVITNTTTGEVLDLTGYSLTAGQTLTIDCRDGVKTVTREDGSNQIAQLSEASDLATFHLAADPDAPGGSNSISVAGSGATTATEVFLQFNPRYIGL